MSASPLMSCWLLFRGRPCPSLQSLTIDPTELVREHHEYGPNVALHNTLHDMFFDALATCQSAVGAFSFVLPGVDEQKLGWTKIAITALRKLAKETGDGTVKPSFAAPFRAMQAIEPVVGRNPTEAEFMQYRSFKEALRQIATDLHLIACNSPDNVRVGAEEFSAARASPHWDDVVWLGENLESRLPLLERDAAGKKMFASLGSAPVQVEGDRFRAKPRRDIPEDEKPTPAMRRAQLGNIKKAQAAQRKRRKVVAK